MPNIKGVEIFSVGTWNGDKYTSHDLEEMVKNFDETKETVKPYLKLGHDNEQKFLQREGIPSAGWIEKLYIQGEKLLADFSDIPQKIYDLIVKKAYRKVSSEIFWNIRIKEKAYRRLLSGVALLGAETPAVMNLNDIMALYGLTESENKDLEIKTYDYQEGNNMAEKSEKEVALETELNAEKEKLQTIEEQIKKFQADLEALKKENDILTSYKKEAEEKLESERIEKEELDRKNFILELEKEKLCTESMKPLLQSLLQADKKEYCIKQNDKEKTYSKTEAFKELFKLFKAAQDVNFDESSIEGKKVEKSIEEKIQNYMTEHKCSYAAAYKTVMRKPEETVQE